MDHANMYKVIWNGKVRRFGLSLIIAFSTSACAEPQLAGDVQAGREKAKVCGMCHGEDGISIIPIYPNLAGQKEGYLRLQLEAFRRGERVNIAMSSHAKKLTDQDIADLSAFYSSLDPRGMNLDQTQSP